MSSPGDAAAAPPALLGDVRRRYLEAQLAGDQRAALRVVDEALAAGCDGADLRREVIQAAQLEIGRLWQENRISIAHEHMATAISQRALVFLFDRATPAPRTGRKILIACVEGELHELPARMLADLLELAGHDVVYLGANVPTASLLPALTAARPDVVALSVTMSFHVDALRAAVHAVRAHAPGVPVVVGGNALAWGPGIADALGVAHTGASATEVLACIDGLCGGAAARSA
jgi:methanogenic corrinoid protein MtbC1